jgi:hypothetical protein
VTENKKSRVRSPLTLFVDKVEFNPPSEFSTEVVRTAYDIELTEYDARKMIEGLQNRLSEHVPATIRVRITGRLVSQ